MTNETRELLSGLCLVTAILAAPGLGGLLGYFVDEVLKLNGTKKGIVIAIGVALVMAIIAALVWISVEL